MKDKKSISEAVIKRLPRYLRLLGEMSDAGEKRASSGYISKQLGFTASQVRQDLSNFGGFGQQGYGYDVEYLRERIEAIIGLTRKYSMIVIGVGNIGKALSRYAGFRRDGFEIKAAFDCAIETGYVSNDVEYLPMCEFEKYVGSAGADIAVIAVPGGSAQAIADRVVDAGITAIWNFAPAELHVPSNVKIENINMSESLYTLCYRLNN